MNAPHTPKPITARSFGYPFNDKQERAITDPQTFYAGLVSVQTGHYLLTSHRFFHGGIHIDRAGSNAFSMEGGIQCLADGEVVAYRINRRYHDATPGTAGDGLLLRPYSTGFVLVRHRLQAPVPPQPPKPAPMENPLADPRNLGTYLYADREARQPLVWLPHGTPLTVEIEKYRPGESAYVRVLDAPGAGLSGEGWINRTWLALDPLAGTGLGNVLGFKQRIATSVHRGDRADPAKVEAYAQNQKAREHPPPPPAPTLTLYSLYMHTADFESYGRHRGWKRPPWWHGRTGYQVKAGNGDPHPRDHRPGLNVRQGSTDGTKIGRSAKIGWLGRGTGVALTGVTSQNGKWGQIEAVTGESDFWDVPVPAGHRGWVHLGSLDAITRPEQFDAVVPLATPHPIKQGDIVGYLGEDVPARASPIANTPVTRKLLHLEVFSGDDVPAYLAASRQWAQAHLPDSERTLLVLRPGEALLDAPNGKATVTLAGSHVAPLSTLEAKEVDGKRWRKVIGVGRGGTGGWVLEEGRLASPWEWPGFDVLDETANESGAMWTQLAETVGWHRRETPQPEETPFYQALRKLLDTDHDGRVSERELDAVLRDRVRAGHIGRIIARHDSEWADASMQRQLAWMRALARQLSPKALESVEAEAPRADKLPWWDEVAAGVSGFPTNPRVYHFHAGGVAGNFVGRGPSALDALIRRIGDIISHGEGGYESYNTGTKGVPNGRVGHSYLNPPAGTVTGRTIDQILETEPLSGTDKTRMFATGKYQTVFATLRDAKRAMRLSGSELYDSEMQEKSFGTSCYIRLAAEC